MLRLTKFYQCPLVFVLILTVTLCLTCHPTSLPVASNQWQGKYHLVKIKIADTDIIEEIDKDPAAQNLIRQIRSHDLKFVSNVGPGFLWALVDDPQLNILQQNEYSFEHIMQADELILHQRMAWGPDRKLPPAYHTYDEIVAQLKSLHRQFPQITTLNIIGKTQQFQKNIYALKLSDNADRREDEPRILFSAAIHGNEIMGAEVTLALLQDLLEKYQNQNEQARQYISNLEIWFVPVINADGYTIATTLHPHWRKNARDNDNDGAFSPADGVDLNRNFDFQFATSGSTEPASKFYRGPAAFSENESQIMADFVKNQKFLFSFTYHSAESRVYYPWRETNAEQEIYTPEDELLTQMAQTIANSIKCINENYNYLPYRNTKKDAYTTNYYYAELGTIDFMIELGKYDHIYPETTLQCIIRHNLPAAYYLLDRAAGPGLTGLVTDQATGNPLYAEIQILPFDQNDDLKPRTTDPHTGRYYRIQKPGTYTVFVKAPGFTSAKFDNITINPTGWTTLHCRLSK